MASIGHIAIGMLAARVYRGKLPARFSLISSMFVWSAISFLPDVDVIGFRYGVAYGDSWGHRGASHSFVFCLFLAALFGLAAKLFKLPPMRTFVVAACVLVSHPLLDTLTDGGLGCALFWPFAETRHFAPWTPIPVSPIGREFFSASGLSVALTELTFFAPLLVYAMWPRNLRGYKPSTDKGLT